MVKFTHLTLTILLATLIFISCGDNGSGDLEECSTAATIANQTNSTGIYLIGSGITAYQSFKPSCSKGNINSLSLRLKATSGTGSVAIDIYSPDGTSGAVSTILETESINSIVSTEARIYTVLLSNKSELESFKEYWIRIVPSGVDIELSTSGATSYYPYGILTDDPSDISGIVDHKDMYFKIVTD